MDAYPPETSAKENVYGGYLSVDLQPSHASRLDSVSVRKNDIALSRSPHDACLVSSIEKKTPIDKKEDTSLFPEDWIKVDNWQIEVTIPRSQPKRIFCNEDFCKSYYTNARNKERKRRGTNLNNGGYQNPAVAKEMENLRPLDVETKCIIVDQNSNAKHTFKVASNEKQQANHTTQHK
jgi:hypothetical protein